MKHVWLWTLTAGLTLLIAARARAALSVDVSVNPASQTVATGSTVTVTLQIDATGGSTCSGGVFLSFDTTKLTFVDGLNANPPWSDNVMDVEPTEAESGIVSLNVSTGNNTTCASAGSPLACCTGSGTGTCTPVTGVALVTTLHFTATATGSAALTVLFSGGHMTQFYDTDCTTPATTTGTNGTVTIAAPTPTLTPTKTPTVNPLTPTPVCPPGTTPNPPSQSCPSGRCGCCVGDANKNGFVNSTDFARVVADFGQTGQATGGQGDANCDGFCNFADFAAVQGNFGEFCP